MSETQSQRPGGSYTRQIVHLLIPIVLQNLLSAAVNSADVVMLNFVGQAHISAVSLAANYANVLFMVFYGLGTGATMLCAQYYGKGDMRAIDVVEGIALRFSMISAAAFALAAFTVPQWMMRLFTQDAELVSIGAGYLRNIAGAYLCWGVIEVYLAVLRSIGRVAVSTALNTTAFLLNIGLNAMFIFAPFVPEGLRGAPGVALATTLSRVAELVLVFVVSARSRDVKLRFRYLFLRNKLLFRDFMKMALPALLNDVIWGLGFSMYSVIIGQFLGTDMVAANSFASLMRNFGTILAFGTASAGGILLGQIIGEGRLTDADRCAKQVLRMTVITGAIGGGIVLAALPLVLNFADLTEAGLGYLRTMLFINSYYVMGAAVNTTLIAGVFRAGGDSRFGMICDLIDMWVYAVPLGFLSAAVLTPLFHWSPMVTYFLLCTDEFVKWPWVIKHYRSKKWLKNITRDDLFAEEAKE